MVYAVNALAHTSTNTHTYVHTYIHVHTHSTCMHSRRHTHAHLHTRMHKRAHAHSLAHSLRMHGSTGIGKKKQVIIVFVSKWRTYNDSRRRLEDLVVLV